MFGSSSQRLSDRSELEPLLRCALCAVASNQWQCCAPSPIRPTSATCGPGHPPLPPPPPQHPWLVLSRRLARCRHPLKRQPHGTESPSKPGSTRQWRGHVLAGLCGRPPHVPAAQVRACGAAVASHAQCVVLSVPDAPDIDAPAPVPVLRLAAAASWRTRPSGARTAASGRRCGAGCGAAFPNMAAASPVWETLAAPRLMRVCILTCCRTLVSRR